MAFSWASFNVFAIIAIIYAIAVPMAHGQSAGPAPAPTSDGRFLINLFSVFRFIFIFSF